ncbi:MAG: metallophosphoesterase family protein [Candidatus Bipolaricaulia bacterium]
MEEHDLLEQAEAALVRDGKLIRLDGEGQAVFVGDTHGDLEATETVIDRYLNREHRIVFLGDYVDRGPHSRENLDLLLSLKVEHPDRIYLLMGNHEGWDALQFYPADFWGRLDPEAARRYAELLSQLPLAVAAENGILALHGALPDVETLEEVGQIVFGSEPWRQIVWGDWQDAPGRLLGDAGGRPQFGRDHFEERMERFEKRVLIRSHQPHAPLTLYGDRCVTIFTSSAYGPVTRRIVRVGLGREVRTAADLQFEVI